MLGIGIGLTQLGIMTGRIPSWVLNPTGARPSIDMDFQNGRYWARSPSDLTVSRASQAYAPDINDVYTSFSSNVARITSRGLLVEESRTNSIRNSSMQGAVAGTPGTLPTNWSIGGAAGLTTSVVGTGTENGVDYIDISFVGTASGTFASIDFETTTAIAAANAQTWAQSVFSSRTNNTNVSFTELTIFENTSGGSQIRQNNTIYVPTTTLTRRTQIATLSGGGTVAAVRPSIQMGWLNGAAINFTVRVGWPQLELGASMTSPIRTTGAAATRAADAISVTPPTLGSSYSLFGQGNPQMPSTVAASQPVVAISDGTSNNRLVLYRSSGLAVDVLVAGGVNQSAASPSAAWSGSGKMMAALALSDFAAVFNGGSIAASTPASMPTGLNTIQLGRSGSGAGFFNGFIERIALWPNGRISNAAMQSITF